MNKTILSLLIFLPALLCGQGTKKISDKKTNESFYVLKSDYTIRHGEYKKFSYNDKLLVKGNYKLGVKDNIWECFNFDGQLTLKYDYNKKELMFYRPPKKEVRKFRIINGNNNTDTTLSRIPIYLDGDDFIISTILQNTRYPAEARVNGISGKVEVLFTIDKSGNTGNYHVEKPLGFGLDEEAIRVLQLLNDNWLPGIQNDQPVDVEVSYPINFRLK